MKRDLSDSLVTLSALGFGTGLALSSFESETQYPIGQVTMLASMILTPLIGYYPTIRDTITEIRDLYLQID